VSPILPRHWRSTDGFLAERRHLWYDVDARVLRRPLFSAPRGAGLAGLPRLCIAMQSPLPFSTGPLLAWSQVSRRRTYCTTELVRNALETSVKTVRNR
jgi:hypothetical protein